MDQGMQLWPGEPARRLRHHGGHNRRVDTIGVDSQIKFPTVGYVFENSRHAYLMQCVRGDNVGAVIFGIGYFLGSSTANATHADLENISNPWHF